jgi:polyphosphate:AMP phosphotransferase
MDKKIFSKARGARMEKLGELQRSLRAANVPVVITFEGWHGAGKGVIINSLVQAMDPRGFKVYTAYYPNDEERRKPFFWQFWKKLPAKGSISIFDRSWYGQIVNKAVGGEINSEETERAFNDVNAFERLLFDDNHVIIKFFAHISEKTHKKRIKDNIQVLDKNMRTTTEDWKEIGLYKQLFAAYEDMFSKTDTAYAPWIAVEAEDENYAQIKVLDYIINVLEKKLAQIGFAEENKGEAAEKNDPTAVSPAGSAGQAFVSSVLSKVDLSKTMEKNDYKDKLEEYQKEIRHLQYKLFRREVATVIVFEGWDAAGKGGVIKRVTANMDPRGYYVTPIAAPGAVDNSYNYLWRFWKEMPVKGMVAIFDRSWYGRLMVERVEGFATEGQWRRAYREINEMEEQLINSGSIVLKFWLQIDKDEQLKRFEERRDNPLKNWKITDEDWRNREKWDKYEPAINEMLFRTSTIHAPWTIVEANCKFYGRIKTMKTIIDAMNGRLK